MGIIKDVFKRTLPCLNQPLSVNCRQNLSITNFCCVYFRPLLVNIGLLYLFKIPITTHHSLNCLTCDLRTLRSPYIIVALLLESLKNLYASLKKDFICSKIKQYFLWVWSSWNIFNVFFPSVKSKELHSGLRAIWYHSLRGFKSTRYLKSPGNSIANNIVSGKYLLRYAEKMCQCQNGTESLERKQIN